MRAGRFARRVGAIVLLLTWSQVATANAVACAAWCALGGTMDPTHVMQAGHDHESAPASHDCDRSIGSSVCDAPQLLEVSVVQPEPLVVPAATETLADPAVARLHSLVSSFLAFDTPPPRVQAH